MAENGTRRERTDDELAAEAPCFGRHWDPTETVCTTACPVEARCVDRVVRHTLRVTGERRGWTVLPPAGALAQALGVSTHAAEVLRHRRLQILDQTRRPAGPAVRAPNTGLAWGEHTYSRRWAREREANPRIAAIQPGMVIRRAYGDRVHTVTCREGYWEYDGKAYASLSAVAGAISGLVQYPKQRKRGVRPTGTRTMATCSGARFFNLERVTRKSKTLR